MTNTHPTQKNNNKKTGCEHRCSRRVSSISDKIIQLWLRSESCIFILFLFNLSDDDQSEQFVERSIIIGDSPNYGEPEPYLTEESSIQRSFPFGIAP
jgi:hypothetical protein